MIYICSENKHEYLPLFDFMQIMVKDELCTLLLMSIWNNPIYQGFKLVYWKFDCVE